MKIQTIALGLLGTAFFAFLTYLMLELIALLT